MYRILCRFLAQVRCFCCSNNDQVTDPSQFSEKISENDDEIEKKI